MPFDTHEAEIHERRNRRSRLVRCVRGWLWEKRHPRLKFGAALLLTALAAVGMAALFAHWGYGWGMRVALGSLSVWPLFLILFLALAAREADEFAAEFQIDRYRSADDLAQGRIQKNDFFDQMMDAVFRQSRDISSLILFTLITGGLFLMWQLICFAPTLLAETIVDAHLVKRKPELERTILVLDWRKELFGGTTLHFLGMSAASGLSAALMNFIYQTSRMP